MAENAPKKCFLLQILCPYMKKLYSTFQLSVILFIKIFFSTWLSLTKIMDIRQHRPMGQHSVGH